jgi:hypothetical protein
MYTAELTNGDSAAVMSGPAARSIYLDHHATTPVDPRVAKVVYDAMTIHYGNANHSSTALRSCGAPWWKLYSWLGPSRHTKWVTLASPKFAALICGLIF